VTELPAEIAAMNKMVVANVNGRAVTRGELSAAFDRVANKVNWKLPINTVITVTGDDMPVIVEAVKFFAGCIPTFTPARGKNEPGVYRVRVKAKGYYAAVGA